MSVMTGTGKRAQHGILIRNAEALETLEKIDTLVVDKTGTLTMGKPNLVAALPVEDIDETEVLAAVARVEMGSEHRLAYAIVEGVRSRGVSPADATDLASTTGEGIEADVNGRWVAIGNEKMMRRVEINDESWLGSAEAGRTKGQTVLFVAFAGKPAGLIAVADPIKPTSANAIAALHARDISVDMLTRAINDRYWLKNPKRKPVITFFVTGLVISLVVEYVARSAASGWRYSAKMPTLVGVGLVPVMMWIVVPLIALGLASRSVAIRFKR